MKKLLLFVVIVVTIILSVRAFALDLPAFPGAEGWGSKTVGGSGRHLSPPNTKLFIVKNLNDSGVGSFRECLDFNGPRTCVFEVGGVIWTTSQIHITKPYLSVFGETAPQPGIIIRGAGLSVETSNVLLRHIKIRAGDDPRATCCKAGSCDANTQKTCTSDPGSRDGINIYATSGPISNVVMDHCSITWALDEGASIAPASYDITGVTYSNNIIASGLDLSIHPEANSSSDPGHSKGTLINGAKKLVGLSYIRNILAHNADRNIRISTPITMEFINNVVYNWARGNGVGRTIEMHNSASNIHFIDLIGNSYIPGPDTFCPETMNRVNLCVPLPNGTDSPDARKKMHYILRPGNGGPSVINVAGRYYLYDNVSPTRVDGQDEWLVADNGFFTSSARTTMLYPANRAAVPQAYSGSVIVMTHAAAVPFVLANSGARTFTDRDSVDANIIQDIEDGTGRIVNCVADDGTPRCDLNAGGWPNYPIANRGLSVPANLMADDNSDGYTNLENYVFSFDTGIVPPGTTTTTTVTTTTTTVTATTTTFTTTTVTTTTVTTTTTTVTVTSTTTSTTIDEDLFAACQALCVSCELPVTTTTTTTTRTTTTRTTTTKTSTTRTSTSSSSTTTTISAGTCPAALNSCINKCEDCARLIHDKIAAYPLASMWPCEKQLDTCRTKLCEGC